MAVEKIPFPGYLRPFPWIFGPHCDTLTHSKICWKESMWPDWIPSRRRLDLIRVDCNLGLGLSALILHRKYSNSFWLAPRPVTRCLNLTSSHFYIYIKSCIISMRYWILNVRYWIAHFKCQSQLKTTSLSWNDSGNGFFFLCICSADTWNGEKIIIVFKSQRLLNQRKWVNTSLQWQLKNILCIIFAMHVLIFCSVRLS